MNVFHDPPHVARQVVIIEIGSLPSFLQVYFPVVSGKALQSSTVPTYSIDMCLKSQHSDKTGKRAKSGQHHTHVTKSGKRTQDKQPRRQQASSLVSN